MKIKINFPMFIIRLFGCVRFGELKNGECFIHEKDAYVMGFGGDPKKGVLIAYRKGGGAKFFKPQDVVVKISRKKFDAFEVRDPVARAMQKATYKRPGYGEED